MRSDEDDLSSVIDYFALGLTHALLAIAFFRLVSREALDREEPDVASGDQSGKTGAKGDEQAAGE